MLVLLQTDGQFEIFLHHRARGHLDQTNKTLQNFARLLLSNDSLRSNHVPSVIIPITTNALNTFLKAFLMLFLMVYSKRLSNLQFRSYRPLNQQTEVPRDQNCKIAYVNNQPACVNKADLGILVKYTLQLTFFNVFFSANLFLRSK